MTTVLLPVMVGAAAGIILATGLVLYGIDVLVEAWQTHRPDPRRTR